MKGDPQVIDVLNEILTAELTAINQYYIHAKMCENWGYKKLYAWKRKESIEEMKDADADHRAHPLPRRRAQHAAHASRCASARTPSSSTSSTSRSRRRPSSDSTRPSRCVATKGDNGTVEMLEDILKGEEHSADELESHLNVVREIGKENYLAQHIYD